MADPSLRPIVHDELALSLAFAMFYCGIRLTEVQICGEKTSTQVLKRDSVGLSGFNVDIDLQSRVFCPLKLTWPLIGVMWLSASGGQKMVFPSGTLEGSH